MGFENWAAALADAAARAAQLEPESGSPFWAAGPSLLKAADDAAKRIREPSKLPAFAALLVEGMQISMGWDGKGILMGWCDPQGLVMHQNDAVCDFLGMTHEEARTKWADAVHPEDRPGVLRSIDTALRVRAPFQLYYRLRHRSGEYRWIHSVALPYRERDDSFGGYVGCGVEVAEAIKAA